MQKSSKYAIFIGTLLILPAIGIFFIPKQYEKSDHCTFSISRGLGYSMTYLYPENSIGRIFRMNLTSEQNFSLILRSVGNIKDADYSEVNDLIYENITNKMVLFFDDLAFYRDTYEDHYSQIINQPINITSIAIDFVLTTSVSGWKLLFKQGELFTIFYSFQIIYTNPHEYWLVSLLLIGFAGIPGLILLIRIFEK